MRAMYFFLVLALIAGVLLPLGLYRALSTDIPLAPLQHRLIYRTFFFHVPSAISTYLLVGLAGAASVGYLLTRRAWLDAAVVAALEVGLAAATFVTISGMMWAQAAWGTPWNWEPRLTAVAVMWFIMAAALILRQAVDDPAARARFSAVFGVLLLPNAGLVHLATRWFAHQYHPAAGTATRQSAYGAVHGEFLFCMLAVVLLFMALAGLRFGAELLTRRAADIRRQAAARPANREPPRVR